jgi:hypothetical protein
MKALAAALLMVLGGCATTLPVPAAPPGAAQAAWARVLDRHVNDRGEVDFAALAAEGADLHLVVADIAAHAPTNAPAAFASRDAALAFHINAYNALAMYVVLATEPPGRLGLLDRLRFFKLTRVVVGGTPISLYDYENDVIRPLGEPLVHVALNCMAVSCPRLPRRPFTPAALPAELETAAREFFNDPRHVRPDPAARRVHLSAILDFYPEDFLAAAPSLIAFANRYRADPIPADHAVAFLPYDWTINRQGRLP